MNLQHIISPQVISPLQLHLVSRYDLLSPALMPVAAITRDSKHGSGFAIYAEHNSKCCCSPLEQAQREDHDKDQQHHDAATVMIHQQGGRMAG